MLNRFIQFIGARRGLRPAPHIQAVAQHNHYSWPNLAETAAQARIYGQSPWVYIAINRVAEAVALVPLRVVRLSSAPELGAVLSPDGERRIEFERHPLERLLDAPNPYLSRFELFEQTVGMLELCGNAYWFLAGDSSGIPAEIWPLRPDRVSIVPDADRYVKGYMYEIDGTRIPLDPAEVVHFKRWHPSNDYYGLSALQAARLAVTGDRAMAEWNRNTFGQDNGVPAGIVSVGEYVNDADFDRIKREWRQTYGGTQRRTAFLRGGGIEWRSIGLNHTDLDFLKGREAHRDEILNIFGIPVGLVSENATEANAKVAERLFIERTLWPKLTRISQKITQELFPSGRGIMSPNSTTFALLIPPPAWTKSAPPTRS
jgi:HK97 family phage portal protein